MKLFSHALFIVVAIFACDIFVVRGPVWFVSQTSGLRFLFNQCLSFLVLWCAFVALFRWCADSRRFRLLCALFVGLVFFLQAAHFGVYRELISPFAVTFFVENPILSLAAGVGELPWLRSLVASMAAFAVVFWGVRTQSSPRRFVVFVSGFFAIAGLITSAVFWFSLPSHQNPLVAFAASCVDSVRTSSLKRMKFHRPDLPPQAPKSGAANIIWVIGESLNLRSMSLYGYERDTTPELRALEASGDVVRFTNVTTIGAHTMIAVPYMLAGMQGIDPHGLVFSKPTVFAYARSAGYQTAFLSAQDTRWGNLETFIDLSHVNVFKNGNSFTPNVSVHKGADDFEVLTKAVFPFLDAAKRPYLAVTQMDGSHYPYSEHSPQSFKKFLPEETPNSVNAYDNTVVYSDHVLASLIRKVRQSDPNAWVFFCSDHPEGVGGNEGGFHVPGGRSLTEVPFLISPPRRFLAEISKNAHAPISQSDVLPTILEIMGIQAQVPHDGFSLLGPIPPGRLRVVSGYMSTLSPSPIAQLIFPDKKQYRIDFQRKSVETEPGVVVPYDSLEASIRERFEQRLLPQSEQN
jgi:glucan phosphoethanolaminetransferase (alkaline phosphatase superfamily)